MANFIDSKGLQAGFGFVVKGAEEIDGVKLVKLKSPWREGEDRKKQEWTGKYHLQDKFWQASKAATTAHQAVKDGEFFMQIEDFKNTFKTVTITHLLEGVHNSFVEKRNAINKKIYKFNFQIGPAEVEPGKATALAKTPKAPEAPAPAEVKVQVAKKVSNQKPEGKKVKAPPQASQLMISEDIADEFDNEEEEDEDDDISQNNLEVDDQNGESQKDDKEENDDLNDEDNNRQLGDTEKKQHQLAQGKIDIDLEADQQGRAQGNETNPVAVSTKANLLTEQELDLDLD